MNTEEKKKMLDKVKKRVEEEMDLYDNLYEENRRARYKRLAYKFWKDVYNL